MWFGTPNGLCRYDGSVLTTYKYKPANENETVNNTVRGRIQEDKKGNIWYTNQTGIYKWNALMQEVVKVFTFEQQYGNSDFSIVHLDEEDNLWLLNIVFGVCRYTIESNRLNFFPLPGSISIPNVQYSFSTVDNEENIWLRVVTRNEPFLKFNRKSGSYSTEFADTLRMQFFSITKKRYLLLKTSSFFNILITNKKLFQNRSMVKK